MGSSRDRLPQHVWEAERRDAEFPALVAREREAERLEAERRAARAASRRKRLMLADYETPIASENEPSQEAKW